MEVIVFVAIIYHPTATQQRTHLFLQTCLYFRVLYSYPHFNKLQDKSTKPMDDVDMSDVNKMDARAKAVAAAGTATAQATL